MKIKAAIPQMYHRRLLLLSAVGVVFALPLLAQMVRLTIVQGEELRLDAERRLVTDRWTPNVRGRVLDRKGRVLAKDRPTFDIAVPYEHITGQWDLDHAAALARRRNREAWDELAPEEREVLSTALRPIFRERSDRLWRTIAELSGQPIERLEGRRNEIKRRVMALAADVSERHRRRRAEQLALERHISFEEAEGIVATRDVRRPIREEEGLHVIVRDVDDGAAFQLLSLSEAAKEVDDPELSDPAEGLHVVHAGRRLYPYESVRVQVDRSTFPAPLLNEEPADVDVHGVATHIIGWMRNSVFKEDVAARRAEYLRRHNTDVYDIREDRGHYPVTARHGAAGVEKAGEYDLRGLRGREVTHLDTGDVEVLDPENGADVYLTLDVELQSYIHALLDPSVGLTRVQPWNEEPVGPDGGRRVGVPVEGDPLAAAVVVIEVDTCDVLAMVSTPSFTRDELRRDAKRVFEDVEWRVGRNRAIDVAYAPGSIVKPLVLCASVTEGVYGVGERLDCTGAFIPQRPDVLRCWIYKRFGTTHTDVLGHALDGSDGICTSCNIFFYEMGERLGPDRLVSWYERFGVGPGVGPSFGIGPQFDGRCGRIVDGAVIKPTLDDARQMAIGQGPIDWTPLHAATAYAALGRSGIYMSPRLRVTDDPAVVDLGLDQSSVDQALDGLRRSVLESTGTTHHLTTPDETGAPYMEPVFNVEGVTVWAKSGTADASAITERTKSGLRVVRDGDHSWCVLLVAPRGERPRFSIAVLVEFGGSGGRVAGPVANQVVRSLVKFGYLRQVTGG